MQKLALKSISNFDKLLFSAFPSTGKMLRDY